jgi:formiminoglutamase
VTLPLLVSNPHAGLAIPPEVADISILSDEEIARDGDEGAAVVYDIEKEVAGYVTTKVARAFVDVNRPADDRSADGVVKTHTCWQVPIYRQPLSDKQVASLLSKYYHPYHLELSANTKAAVLGIDCHTMAAVGPPIGPGAGEERPAICVSNADTTCPRDWLELMANCLQEAFAVEVAMNQPFRGGFIIRSHAAEMPWLQIELSRAPFRSGPQKRERLLAALEIWCSRAGDRTA